jgi:hypothetical protein
MAGKALFAAEMVSGTVVSNQLASIDIFLWKFCKGDTRKYLFVNSFFKKYLVVEI